MDWIYYRAFMMNHSIFGVSLRNIRATEHPKNSKNIRRTSRTPQEPQAVGTASPERRKQRETKSQIVLMVNHYWRVQWEIRRLLDGANLMPQTMLRLHWATKLWPKFDQCRRNPKPDWPLISKHAQLANLPLQANGKWQMANWRCLQSSAKHWMLS